MSAKKEVAKPSADAPVKSGKGKLIAVFLAAVVGAAGAGGGIAWFMAGKAANAASAKSDKGGKSKTSGAKQDDAKDEGEDAEKGESKARGAATYLALNPAFVVNLAEPDASRYMQASVEVMTRDAKSVDALKLHMPAIRNSLLMLFGQKTAAEVSGRDGREALRQLALTEVQKVMDAETGDEAIEALYFTSFVIQ